MKRETRRFHARGDGGTVYTVIEHQKVFERRALSGAPLRGGGSRDLELADGTPVNYLDESTFQVLDSAEIIRRVP